MRALRTRDQIIHRLFSNAVIAENGCVRWMSPRKDGYGAIKMEGRTYGVHRLAYMLQVGPIPDGLVIDHACHSVDDTCEGGPTCLHRSCINVAHLRVMTGPMNSRLMFKARRPVCKYGHPLDEANTYRWRGARYCRTCNRQRAAESKARKRVAS